MCGGYSIISDKNTLKKRFSADSADYHSGPNYNARPGQRLPVVMDSFSGKIVEAFWGFRPHWANAASSKAVINARSETLAAKSYFKDSFLHRRCLVIADSFYEWKKTPAGKQPFLVSLKTDEPFAMAGIWDENIDNHGEIMPVFAIITVEANEDMKPIHERMPVILLPEHEKEWLTHETSPEHALKLLQSCPKGLIKTHPVSKKVNSPANNGPQLHSPF